MLVMSVMPHSENQPRLGGRRSVSLEFWPVVLPLWRTLKCLHLISFQDGDKSEEGYASSGVHHPALSLSLTRMVDDRDDDDFSLFGEQEELPAITLLQSIDADLLVVCSVEEGYTDESDGHNESIFLCSRGALCGREWSRNSYMHRYEIWLYRPCIGYMHSSQLNRCRTLDDNTMEYSPICIYNIAIGEHLVCVDAGSYLFFMRTGLQKEQGVKCHLDQPTDIELVLNPIDMPSPKSCGNHCQCCYSRQLKGGKWWEVCALKQKHCFEGDERWSSASSLDIEELMHELIKPHFSPSMDARVMDYESRLISRPLLHNSSALLAFSVLLQTTLPPRGYRDNLNAGHRRSEVVFNGGSIDFVLAVHHTNGHIKVLYELFEPLHLTGDFNFDCVKERATKLQKKWSIRMNVTSRVLDNYPLLAGESMSRLENKQLACAIVMD
eukprot:472294_1